MVPYGSQWQPRFAILSPTDFSVWVCVILNQSKIDCHTCLEPDFHVSRAWLEVQDWTAQHQPPLCYTSDYGARLPSFTGEGREGVGGGGWPGEQGLNKQCE